jgi:hypothetical protein
MTPATLEFTAATAEARAGKLYLASLLFAQEDKDTCSTLLSVLKKDAIVITEAFTEVNVDVLREYEVETFRKHLMAFGLLDEGLHQGMLLFSKTWGTNDKEETGATEPYEEREGPRTVGGHTRKQTL